MRILMAIFLVLTLGCGPALADSPTIVFADLSWNSVMVHNRIVGFIIEKGMGYKADYVPGATATSVAGMAKGDIHVDMESWTLNIQEIYDKYTKSGEVVDLGPNFGQSWEGWLVPTYVIKGDKKRGIKALAPDLKSVEDLKKYSQIFKDPEEPDKGRFYNGVAGWQITKKNTRRLKAYGLDKYFTDFIPGSDAALSGSMAAAYKRGKPWLGYYWAPTWALGLYDMTPLKEPAFDPKVEKETGRCALPSNEINILIWSGLPKMAPDVVELLKKYETTMEINNKFLAHMRETKGDSEAGAIFFLKNYQDLWTKWVSPEVADKVKAALK